MALTVQKAIPFFRYAREREAIRHRRHEEKIPRPWTQDAILGAFRFCNVYREDDATTAWFRKWVRDPLRSSPEVLLATVLFRWFNRSTTGDAIFRQLGDFTDGRGSIRTSWEQFLLDGRTESIRTVVRSHCGGGPYVTGSYIIKTVDGMNKLDGVLWAFDKFATRAETGQFVTEDGMLAGKRMGWREYAELMLSRPGAVSLEMVWDWLRRALYLGDFMAYEIVTDLRHTDLLSRAPDIYTWANPGPGAMRGLNRLHERDLSYTQKKHMFVCEMRQILDWVSDESCEAHYMWPRRDGQRVEMRDIEHTLCEFDKYERARLGQGRPRGVLK